MNWHQNNGTICVKLFILCIHVRIILFVFKSIVVAYRAKIMKTVSLFNYTVYGRNCIAIFIAMFM